MGRSNVKKRQVEPDCLTPKAGLALDDDKQDKQLLSAIAESVVANNLTISPGKSHTCTPSSRKRKSSKISAVDSTTSEKVLEPYWNELCAVISSRLLLPVETDLPDLGLNSLNTWSVSTVEKSWFSTSLKVVRNRNLPQILSPLFTSSQAVSTDSENTAKKSKKIRVFLNPEQRSMIRQWFGVSRYVFNKTVKILENGEVKANWFAIKTDILNDLPDWCKAVPYQIKSIAIKDACTAVREAKKKYNLTGQFNRVRFRSRKNPVQSCYIPKSAVSAQGIYHTKLGELTFTETLPENICDCRLTSTNGDYYLVVPYKTAHLKTESQGRVVALDPGVRTFLTFFSETSVGKIGHGDFSRIQRLCQHLDNLISKISKAKGKGKYRMRKAARRIIIKIQNFINELHHKAARFLVDNFDVILLPTFETSQMSKKPNRKLRSKTVRNMLSFAHYRFKEFLKHKASENGKVVVDVCEAYTSKTVSWTGELINIGGSKIIKSKIDGQMMDRDINGARGIFLRALVDTPWLSNQLALASQNLLLVDSGS
ncbi:RNA-guided endonuclease InsQ/TnpB family protein [Moorena sp. SIO1F2]|uniref:RNA-guided endonuclease InsQ/TnpB family protein n=1 Tax=Moorena sp. SIO1F2 TaxID=2607819 RepID=UPI00345BCD96